MAVCRNGSEVADAVLQDGFYRLFLLAKNVCIRLVTRLLPNGLRSLLYKRLIRVNSFLSSSTVSLTEGVSNIK